MRNFLLIFATFLLASCGANQVQTVFVVPDVDPELLAPRTVPERNFETLADVGVILADHVQALDAANGDKAAIDQILTCAADASECEEQ